MARRQKKKPPRVYHQSVGPLPLKIASQFLGQLLVFSDASRKIHGGLAAVLFAETESVPLIATQRVELIDSNQLELMAALFALQQAATHFPGQQFTLFSDNIDTVIRLNLAKTQGLAVDPDLTKIWPTLDLEKTLPLASFRWIKGHASCRGNTLADENARKAAESFE
jgi:ribonuclease HI